MRYSQRTFIRNVGRLLMNNNDNRLNMRGYITGLVSSEGTDNDIIFLNSNQTTRISTQPRRESGPAFAVIHVDTVNENNPVSIQ